MDELIWDEAGDGGSGHLLLATVGSSSSSLGTTLKIDGATEAGSQRYRKINNGQTLAAGDRVLVAQVGGSYVILGKITY